MIGTSRYNNETWLSNCLYREKNQIVCLYGCPCPISSKVLNKHPIFIVEMNNSTNQILGIGYILNSYETARYYKVYDCINYNRYVYKGNYRVDRTTIEKYNPRLLEIFDTILFKEKTHMKRGRGITLIPEKLLNHPLCKDMNLYSEIKTLFLIMYRCIGVETESCFSGPSGANI
jgi:hypothetical protein